MPETESDPVMETNAAEVPAASSAPSADEAAPEEPEFLDAQGADDDSKYDDESKYDDDAAPEAPEQPAVALPSRAPLQDHLRIAEPVLLHKTAYQDSPNFLLESKFNKIKASFERKDAKNRQQINVGLDNIRSLFSQIKSTTTIMSTEKTIDWNIWEQVVNDYEKLVQSSPAVLNAAIMDGVPEEIRGIVWQSISKSKNLELEEYYLNLKHEPSIHEKQIKRDITRTSFFNSIQKINKSADLFSVIKNYSLFDPEVGYTQGMIFIATPLVIALSESEAFTLLVTLMKEYGLRELFLPDMKGLHLMLYKFDRLLEIYSPVLFNHLSRQGIKSSMYASQWFLTLFSYKFPIEIVLRIYDILITQGIEALLKFSINLMIRNEHNLLNLRFDQLLAYLKDHLFSIYVSAKYVSKTPKKLADVKDYYDLGALVGDSMQINFNPNDLERYELEFDKIYENDAQKKHTIDTVNAHNGKLRSQIKDLQMSLVSLNKDHMTLVQNLVNLKIKLPELLNDQAELREQTQFLEQEIASLKSKGTDSDVPVDIDHEITKLLEINKQETEKNMLLEDELHALVDQERDLDEKLGGMKKGWFWSK